MGHLVGQHRFQLAVVERLHQAGGDRDAVLAFMQAGGEGVHGVGLDDPERGGLHAARDREVLQQIIDPGQLLAGHRAGAGREVDDRLIGEIGDDEPDQGHPDRQRGVVDQHLAGDQEIVVGGVGARQVAEAHHQQHQGVDHAQQQHGKAQQQQGRPDVVVPDVGLKADGPHGAAPS